MKLVLGSAFSLLFLTTQAQHSQQFRGTVTDQVLQQPLAGATVTIHPTGRSVVTDATGVFRFSNIPVGSYQISISYTGYKDGVVENIVVNSGKETVLNIYLKTIYAGGLRTTPIDYAASQQQGYTVFKEKEAYSLQNTAYFRTDIRVSMTWNRRHITSTLSMDIQNLTNRLNEFGQWYDSEKNKIVTTYQTGLIPVLNYKIEF